MKKSHLSLALSLALASMFSAPSAYAADQSQTVLQQKVDKLATELEALKAELAEARKKTAEIEQKQAEQKQTQATVSVPPSRPMPPPAHEPHTHAETSASPTVLSGYGEIAYQRPNRASEQTQVDVARAVIGVTHRFDAKTKMVSEFEWEHAVTSKDDDGEAALEQLYIEHEIQPNLSAKFGLFLIPMGFMNTNHEPTAYYGVHRNFVETAIIPTTWREVGLGLSGSFNEGWSWDTGITTGFNLNKWDAQSEEGRESPLGAIHQEGQLAKARDLSLHAALNYRGVPGLLIGGSVFTGKAGHAAIGGLANDSRITLWDVHARYQASGWDLSALYAKGQISHTQNFNLSQVGGANPIPASFAGGYVQAAYNVWKNESYLLSPFLRYEQFNTALSYAPLPAGLTTQASPSEKVGTLGLQLKIGEGVVIKTDYQKFRRNRDLDRFNIGAGYAF